jgi:hypothetical protein
VRSLIIGVHPHLIPAITIPARLLERAMSEPLAAERDEVLYLICTHERLRFAQGEDSDGWRLVIRADGDIGGIAWDVQDPWARVRLPDGAQPSALGWAVLDPLVESLEGLTDPEFDPTRDPEGEAGRHRQELLPWIFDRHLEIDDPPEQDRGEVEGGHINFRLEYIGKANREALRRAAGAHHKMPLILSRMLVFEPSRLVYILPCDIRAATYDPSAQSPVPVPVLAEAVASTGVPRELLISAAEEALIAGLGAPENRQNTQARQFPRSNAGDQLVALGINEVFTAFSPLAPRVTISAERTTVDRESRAVRFELGG